MLNEPRDINMAKYSCSWAESEIKRSSHLIKANMCGDSELCQRALDINAACKVIGPAPEVRSFHTKLLTQFASTARCSIEIMRLSDDKSDTAIKNNLEANRRANWKLNLGFSPWQCQTAVGFMALEIRRDRPYRASSGEKVITDRSRVMFAP